MNEEHKSHKQTNHKHTLYTVLISDCVTTVFTQSNTIIKNRSGVRY